MKTLTSKNPSGKDYYLETASQIIARGNYPGNQSYDTKKLYDYYYGHIDPMIEHQKLLKGANNMEIPVDFINYNKITGQVDSMVNIAMRMPRDMTVKAASTNAFSRKWQKLMDMTIDQRLLPLYIRDQEEYGFTTITEEIPETEEQLEEKKKNYKEDGEIVYQRIIDWWMQKNNWKKRFVPELLRDVLISGYCAVESAIERNGARAKIVQPDELIFDASMTSPFGEDMKFVGKIAYTPLNECIEKYKLTEDQIKSLRDRNQGEPLTLGRGSNKQYAPLKTIDGLEHVLEARIEWKAVDKLPAYQYTDGQDTSWKTVTTEEEEEAFINEIGQDAIISMEEVPVQVVHYAVILGDAIIPEGECGRLKNMVRTVDDWQTTEFSIEVFFPRWKMGRNVSVVEQIIPFQKLIDACIFKIMQAFRKDKGKFFLNDVAQIPNGYTFWDQMFLGETEGTYPIHSRQNGVNANYTQWQAVDMSLPPTISIYGDIINMCKSAISEITGLDSMLQGEQQMAAQKVGTGQQMRESSLLRVEGFYSGFDLFTERFITKVIGQHKILMAHNPTKFSHILGEDGIDHLVKSIDTNLDDYGMFITTYNLAAQDQQAIRDMTATAVQQLQLSFIQGLEIFLTDNPNEAMIKLKKYQKEVEAKMMAAQQQQQQAAQQQAEAQFQLDQQKLQIDQRKNQESSENERNKISVDEAIQRLANRLKAQEAEKDRALELRKHRDSMKLERLKIKSAAKAKESQTSKS